MQVQGVLEAECILGCNPLVAPLVFPGWLKPGVSDLGHAGRMGQTDRDSSHQHSL